MRSKVFLLAIVALLALAFQPVLAQTSEDEIVNRYLEAARKKQIRKLGWLAVNFGVNRINRNNDYNRFVSYENSRFTGADWQWLNVAPIVGVDFGVMLSRRFAWNLGGEYWFNFGQKLTGTYTYNTGGTPVQVTDPESKLTVWGAYTGVQYYLLNPPSVRERLTRTALRVGGSVGWYTVAWDLWPEYANLNLSTSTSTGVNTTYKDNAPALTINLGADHPLGFYGLVLSADVDYLYLNFDRVAWYNSIDQEVVATWAGTPDTRVDLNFSGVRGRIQVKRFINW